jgi:thioredoxin 1
MKAIGAAICSLILILCLTGCSKPEEVGRNNMQEITSLGEFQDLVQNGVSMVFFHAVWCSRCKAQRPAVEALVDIADFSQVKFLEVDYEKVRSVADVMNVVGFPTILILRDGVEVERFLGQGHAQADLESKLRSHL